MAVFSKYFLQTVNTKKCAEIIHDGSCIDSTIWNFTHSISTCVKFVLPLALVAKRFGFIFELILPFLFLLIYFSSGANDNERQECWQRCGKTKCKSFLRLFFGCLANWWMGSFAHLLFSKSLRSIQLLFGAGLSGCNGSDNLSEIFNRSSRLLLRTWIIDHCEYQSFEFDKIIWLIRFDLFRHLKYR